MTADLNPPRPSASASTIYCYVEIDSVRIFLREAGPPDAPTVVVLHSYSSSSRQYDALLPLLADRYHLVAPDYPGFGHSNALPPDRFAYRFDNLAMTMGALVARLGIAHHAPLMQNYGGPVRFRMATAHPEQVTAIIVQNANAFAEGLGPKWRNITRFWDDPAAHPEQVDTFMSLEGAKQRHIYTSRHPEHHNPDSWTDEHVALMRPGQREIQAAPLLDCRTDVAAYPAWQAWMRAHRPPILVLWGRNDLSFLVPGAEAYRCDLPDAEVHILDGGHFAMDEQTAGVARLTRDFLGRHLGSATSTRLDGEHRHARARAV